MTAGRETAIFEDRRDAGRRLAAEMAEYRGSDSIVVGLARGGVPVAAELASCLELDLDVTAASHLTPPANSELAVGAVGELGGLWLDEEAIDLLDLSRSDLEEEISKRRDEVARAADCYRSGRGLSDLSGRNVILTVDGLATGHRVLAVMSGLRRVGPALLVLAAPVALAEALWRVSKEADRVVCLATPIPFQTVGVHFRGFETLSDDDVGGFLTRWG